jgi:hypothetical protein
MAYYLHAAEIWDAAKCHKAARHIARDGLGTPYPFPGYIGDSFYGTTRYNGGCIRNDQLYEGEIRPLPQVPVGYEIVRVRTWGWRIIEKESA